jgi:hypothetical protein
VVPLPGPSVPLPASASAGPASSKATRPPATRQAEVRATTRRSAMAAAVSIADLVGASEPLIQIGDLRSRRSKGGSNLLTTNRTVASRVPGRFRPCGEKDFRWKTKAGKCPNT